MKNLCALLTASLLSLAPTWAGAAPVTLNFSGSTISTITDGTNFFGLGNTIAQGTTYSFNVTYDETQGVTGTGLPIFPLTGFQGHSYCCSTGGGGLIDFGPGANHITLVELIMNGTTLSAGTPTFDTFISDTFRLSGTCCGTFPTTTNQRKASMTGSSSNGSSVDFAFDYFFNSQPILTGNPPRRDTIDITTLAGSISLLLIATDGSTVANLTANNAFGLFGQVKGGDPSDVPVPAALPLLAAGLAGLGTLSRRKRKFG